MRFSLNIVLSLATLVPFVSADFGIQPPSVALNHQFEKRAQAKVYTTCTTAKQVAITFDDGPYIFDGAIQAQLQRFNAKATFFVNGNNWECGYDDARIAAMRSLFAAGHEFGSHTWQHEHLPQLTWDQMHDQMWKTEQLLIRVLGVNPALMRPPYGEYDSTVSAAAAARNQSIILWDFDSGDSTGSTAAQSKARYNQTFVTQKKSTSIALNHATSNSTANDVLPYALQTLSNAGYTFVTVSQCLKIKPYQFTQPPGKKDSTWHC